jgi:hypothetical protein
VLSAGGSDRQRPEFADFPKILQSGVFLGQARVMVDDMGGKCHLRASCSPGPEDEAGQPQETIHDTIALAGMGANGDRKKPRRSRAS